MNNEEFIKFHYPGVRVLTADTGRINRDKHYVKALLEVDITTALQKLKSCALLARKSRFRPGSLSCWPILWRSIRFK